MHPERDPTAGGDDRPPVRADGGGTGTDDGTTGGRSGRVARTVGLVRAVAARTTEADVTFLAAAVAYYAFVSLLPGAVLALVVAAWLGGPRLAAAVIAASAGVLTETGQQLLVSALLSGGGTSATLIGLPLALWGALKVLRGIDTAFARVYGLEKSPSLGAQLRDSLVVAASVGASAAVMFGLGTAAAALRLGPLVEVASVLALPVVLTAAFLPMYYVFPEPRVPVREALPGAVFAGVGWTALQAGFQAYVEFQAAGGDGQVALYGALGAVLLLVTFLYFGAIVLLVGVVLNVVRAEGRRVGNPPAGGDGDEPEEPEEPGEPPGGRRATDGGDRQRKGTDARAGERMSGSSERAGSGERDDDRGDRADTADREERPAPDVAELEERVAELRADLDDVRGRTVEKPALEAELKRYVRRRMRRGHARGWGPYLVLLYGTVMTLGAFYFLSGWVAVAAMLVLFLSTLGLYTLFVLVGVGLNLLEVPGRAVDAVRDRR